MLNYYYRFKAPPENTSEKLRSFLESVGAFALKIGFGKAVAIDCTFDSADQLAFARRICLLPSLDDERLKRADFSSDPSVFRQDRKGGSCRIYPDTGIILVVVDRDGFEATFGFLRFPEAISGVTDDGATLSIDLPAGSYWTFEQSVQSDSPRLRELVKMFDDEGFLDSSLDEYSIGNGEDTVPGQEYSDYVPSHPELIPDDETDARHRLAALEQTEGSGAIDRTTFVEGWWSLFWLFPGLHPDGWEEWSDETEKFKPYAQEAFRRFEKGEIDEEELYPAEASHNRMWKEMSAGKQGADSEGD